MLMGYKLAMVQNYRIHFYDGVNPAVRDLQYRTALPGICNPRKNTLLKVLKGMGLQIPNNIVSDYKSETAVTEVPNFPAP